MVCRLWLFSVFLVSELWLCEVNVGKWVVVLV